MKIDEYLFRRKMTRKDFAKEIGVCRMYVSYLIGGSRKASMKLAKIIEGVTEGLVTIEELRPDERAEK